MKETQLGSPSPKSDGKKQKKNNETTFRHILDEPLSTTYNRV